MIGRWVGLLVGAALLAAATAFLSINLWTGSPVLALWVGSRAADERMLSVTSLFVVVLTFAVVSLAISAALLWFEQHYRAVGIRYRTTSLPFVRGENS